MLSLSKRIVLVFMVLILCSCSLFEESNDSENKYNDMIEMIETYDAFIEVSDYFDISCEKIANNEGSYSFYITIDEPRVAMYDISAVAIEKGVDYSQKMAANVGVFDDRDYSMIPNQANPNKGYYSGVVISGTTDNENAELYLMIQWKSKDLLTSTREYIKITV